MNSHLVFSMYIVVVVSVFSINGSAQNDVSSLLSIKASLIDPNNNLKNWEFNINYNTTLHQHCTWNGVFCDFDGFVTKLDLSNMNLSGQVSEKLQSLQFLTSLNLSCNGFSSFLPKSLSNLTSLITLDVSQNEFFGDFPTGLGMASGLLRVNASSNNFSGFLPDDLGNATLLESLDFRGSFLEGSIPVSFKKLQKLRFLGISGNNLTGEIPPEIGELVSLETMIIGYNAFKGGIPVEFGNLVNLQYLDMAEGGLEGEIPSQLGKLQKLTTLFLYKNNFSGKIPKEMGNISSLVMFDLSDNQLSGVIPIEITELKNLQLLNLMCNQLTGTIPEKLGDLTKLEVLELWKNSLTGHLPMNLGKNSPLQWLDVSSNSLSGEIPSGLCDYGNLTKLILFSNSFSGSLPIGLCTCPSLVRVRVQNNFISGEIPIGFGALPKLQRLELAKNNLTGDIPDDIALSASLSFIDVSWNQLHSSLPPNIFSISNLQTFIASNNRIDGNIPNQFQDCPSLYVLDLSTNLLSGEIPESIASCQKLVNLNLRNNKLEGGIPCPVSTMPTLAILDLSNNSLTGRIPSNFGSSPALEMFNLSYNKLSGPVPNMLISIDPSELIGNAGLCGGVVLPPCSEYYTVNTRAGGHAHISHVIIGFVVGLSVVILIGGMIFTARIIHRKWYLYSAFYTHWFSNSSSSKNAQWPWRLVAFQRLSFNTSDILSCIHESNVIGTGGTGIVYKAEIQRPQSTVAVKKLWRSRPDNETTEDLLKEVNLLGRLRHRNIVRLLGYIHNESDVIMLYEYMPNGNLGNALHGSGKFLVDWVARYNVAIGVAQGLHYLHHDCHPPIIHRDIKSNNILLDANLDARIADFGLARMMVRDNETVSMVAGSYGYIAPEYGYTLKVNEKSDVYSFGVVLLELLTGKTPLDPAFGESTDIVEWVQRKKRDNRAMKEALDATLAGGECDHVQEEMLLVLRIAVLCTSKFPKDRPSMRDVILMLGEAKPRRKSISYNTSVSKEKPMFGTSLFDIL